MKSISEESSETISNFSKHLIKLLLSVEFIILTESCVIISYMLPYFVIESLS